MLCADNELHDALLYVVHRRFAQGLGVDNRGRQGLGRDKRHDNRRHGRQIADKQKEQVHAVDTNGRRFAHSLHHPDLPPDREYKQPLQGHILPCYLLRLVGRLHPGERALRRPALEHHRRAG